MPKTTDTRKQRAAELLKRIQNGPAYYVNDLSEHTISTKNANIQAAKTYKMWVNSWIIDELIALVPELKKEHDYDQKI